MDLFHVRKAASAVIGGACSIGGFGLLAAIRCAVYEGLLRAESAYSSSTASLSCSEFTSIYLWVVLM